MKFKDKYHETLFCFIMQKMKSQDVYHRAVAYLIALDDVCRNHVEDMFNFTEDVIVTESLNKGWQTGTSKRTARLAFNLWNGWDTDGESYTDDDGCMCSLPSRDYTVDNIFCCPYAPYYWEAVKIRYPEYAE